MHGFRVLKDLEGFSLETGVAEDGEEEEEEEEQEAVALQTRVHGFSKFTSAGFLAAGITLMGVAYLMDPNLISQERRATQPDNAVHKTVRYTFPATVSELLYSRALRQVVEGFAVHAVESNLKLSKRSNPSFEFPVTWRQDVRMEARTHYDLTVRKLFDASPNSRAQFQNSHLNPEQAEGVVSALHALSDPRFLDIGEEIGSACTARTMKALEICALEVLAPRATEIRQLREKLLPAALHSQNEVLKEFHLQVLRQGGYFAASTELGGWHAEVAVSPSRMLQSGEITPALRNYFSIGAPIVSVAIGALFQLLMAVLPGESGMPTNRNAGYSMFALEAAAVLSECLLNIKRGIVLYASCGLDILFLGIDSIFVFVDGQFGVTAPQRVTNCASYTEWNNLTGTCGNCMATSTSRLGGVDGINTCNNFCSSFGHGCKYAAVAADGSCVQRGQYKCEERFPLGHQMLCQCFTGRLLNADAHETNEVEKATALRRLQMTMGVSATTNETTNESTNETTTTTTMSTTSTTTTPSSITPRPGIENIKCASYPIWPNIQAAACGNCRALAPSRCDTYCQSFNHTCFAAAIPDGNTCMEDGAARCNEDPGPQGNMLCTCGLVNGQQAPSSMCAEYPQWLTIEARVCGNCTAVARLNVPTRPFPNCNSFCESFGHVCERAAMGSTIGNTPCIEVAQMNCATTVSGIKEALCSCVLP